MFVHIFHLLLLFTEINKLSYKHDNNNNLLLWMCSVLHTTLLIISGRKKWDVLIIGDDWLSTEHAYA